MHWTSFPPSIRQPQRYGARFDALHLAAEAGEALFARYPAGTQIGAHSHPTDNYGVITKGEMLITVADVERRYGPGDWYHVPADEPHSARGSVDSEEIAFWFYLAAMSLMAIGYADFNLISFHLQRVGDPTGAIPILYAVAMGAAAVSALVFGRWFDRWGMAALMLAALLSAAFAPFAFLGNLPAAVIGVALWGIGMGVQDSIMSAPISVMVHADKRANAFGIFNSIYGVAWFAGSTAMGLLYGYSILALVLLSVLAQLSAAAVLFSTRGRLKV